MFSPILRTAFSVDILEANFCRLMYVDGNLTHTLGLAKGAFLLIGRCHSPQSGLSDLESSELGRQTMVLHSLSSLSWSGNVGPSFSEAGS